MHADDSDATLLARARRDDEDAFRALYERHCDAILRFVYRLVGNASFAEDIVHDCFVGLIDRPEGFDPARASLRTYLCGTARHLAFQYLRRHGVQIDMDDGDLDHATAIAPQALDRILGDEIAAAVGDAVRRLPPLQREALVLFEYEEMTLAEIAEVAGVNVATVSSRLSRARERLRAWLADVADAAVPDVRRRRS